MGVRPAVAADVGALVRLEEACFAGSGSPPWSHALLTAELDQPTALMLAAVDADGFEEREAPVGYASFRHVGAESELLRVAVDPSVRGRGIGRRLVEAGLQRLRDLGVSSCFLEVRPENRPALALYRRLGFRQVARRPRYFADGSDALVLETRIARAPRGPARCDRSD